MAQILVVDDRPLNRQLLVTLLGYYGHTVAQAEDGMAALEQVGRVRPDLVITDLLMPNMDGEQLCRRLRADPATADLPIIIHTASYRARQARQIADSVGVRWVLPKPSDPVEIVAVVTEALGLGHVPRPQAPMPAGLVEAEPAQGEATEGTHEVQDRLAKLQRTNQRLTELLDDASQVALAQSRVLAAVELGPESRSLVQRLRSLVSLGLQRSWERDPDVLVDKLCAAAQDILSARYAGIVVLAPQGGVRRFVARGLDQAQLTQLSPAMESCPAALRLLGQSDPTGMIVAAREGDFTGLPEAHPRVQTLLACPVAAQDTTIGWMYVADQIGGGRFSADDERLLLALAAELAIAWNGVMVLDDLDRRVSERTRQLEAANAELEAFSMLVSHDLRSPLGNIDGFAKALDYKFGDILPPDAKRFLGNIERNVTIMTRLIEDLLHFARTSRTGIVPCTVNLDRLVQECLDSFRDEIAHRAVSVTVGPLTPCRADPALLMQVLLNLVGNALKYTRKQQHPAIEIGSQRLDAEQVFFVRDNGTGFDMQDAGSLFSPFGRLHSASEFEGSGIGLALVKQIVTRHGGRVWVEAQPGQGACFFFSLPSDTPAS